jgi:hypothetical protein
MPPKLQVLSNFKLKYFFGGRVLGKALAPNEFVSFDESKSNHMGE